MLKIKNNIIIFLQLFTVFSLTMLILYRFRIRIPREIFINPSYYFLYLYLFIFIINVIVFIILFLAYKEFKIKPSLFTEISLKIKRWIEDSYEKVMTIIAELPGIFSIVLAYITHYYLKIPLILLQIILYIPRMFLCFAISFDVFYLEKFHYSYIIIYLLLLTLVSKTILYISYEINERILADFRDSVIIIDPEKTTREYYENPNAVFNIEDYALSQSNVQYTTIKEALHVFQVVNYELKLLHIIKNKLEIPMWFTLLIRGFYVIVFGYIVIKYPIWF